MARRTDEGRDPSRMNERQRGQFDEHGRIIRMTDKAKRTARDHAERYGIHDLDIPVRAQRANDPPPERICEREQRPHADREYRDERTMQQQHFERRAGKHRGVQQHHPTEVRVVGLGDSLRCKSALIATRNHQ